jgi:hypothetical protein
VGPGALIVAIAANKLWPLELLHVAFGAAWTIIDLFVGLVLGPILGRLSIPARALGLLEPANIAVLFELKKERPNRAVIEHLMK